MNEVRLRWIKIKACHRIEWNGMEWNRMDLRSPLFFRFEWYVYIGAEMGEGKGGEEKRREKQKRETKT